MTYIVEYTTNSGDRVTNQIYTAESLTNLAKNLEEWQATNIIIRSSDIVDDNQDKPVSISHFLNCYNRELDRFNRGDESSHIYGYNFTLHWNGMYCDLEDGATVYNHLIPALKDIKEEIE